VGVGHLRAPARGARYGEATYGIGHDARLASYFITGLFVVPGVPESFPRGDYFAWIETGTSSFVNHSRWTHLQESVHLQVALASDYGTDERTYLNTALNGLPRTAGWIPTSPRRAG